MREVVVSKDAMVPKMFGHSRSSGRITSNCFEACTVGVLQMNGVSIPILSIDIMYDVFNNV